MRNTILKFTVAVTAAALFALGTGTSFAQGAPKNVVCIEGRAANGDCMNPSLAAMQRKMGVVFSQSRISRTSPIYSSHQERTLALPPDYIENYRMGRNNP